MKDDERKLMITIGNALKAQGEAIMDLQKKGVSAPSPDVRRAEPVVVPGIVSQISHEKGSENLRMSVQFENADAMPFEARQKKCESFLAELRGLLEDYKVVKMDGNYAR